MTEGRNYEKVEGTALMKVEGKTVLEPPTFRTIQTLNHLINRFTQK